MRQNIFLTNNSEAIAPQLNDRHIAQMQELIADMRYAYNHHNKDDYMSYLTELSRITKERFGIPVKYIHDLEVEGPCTMTYSLLDESTGFDHTSDILARSLSLFEKFIIRIADQTEIYEHLKDSSRVFSAYLKAGAGLEIDTKKVYVKGLPDDYDCYIYSNWDAFFDKSSVWYTPLDEEILGVILHEMGHIFSRLEYLYKTRRSILAFEDACRDIIKQGGKTGYQYVLVYKHHTGSAIDAEKYKNVSPGMCYIGVIADIGKRYAFDGTMKSSVDMEFVADQFTTRFGFGHHTSNYFVKFAKQGLMTDGIIDSGNSFFSTSLSIIWTGALFGCILLWFGVTSSLTILPIIISICFAIYFSIMSIFFSESTASYDNVYDIPYLRIERMCRDVIRQLRIYGQKLSREDKGRLVSSVDDLLSSLKTLKRLGYSTRGMTANVVAELLNSKLRERREIVEFNEDLERLMENRLHHELARIQSLT